MFLADRAAAFSEGRLGPGQESPGRARLEETKVRLARAERPSCPSGATGRDFLPQVAGGARSASGSEGVLELAEPWPLPGPPVSLWPVDGGSGWRGPGAG